MFFFLLLVFSFENIFQHVRSRLVNRRESWHLYIAMYKIYIIGENIELELSETFKKYISKSMLLI